MNVLNPVMRVGDQFVDMFRAHDRIRRADALARAGDLLELVGIDRGRVRSYPHELSGGMRQRVVIAMALALEPELIVMDEPTTALDVVVQREILQELETLKKRLGFAVALHHARPLAARRVQRPHRDHVRGRDRRVGALRRALPAAAAPVHRRPDALVPAADGPDRAARRHPGLAARTSRSPPAGCRFHPRCPHCTSTDAGAVRASDERAARCCARSSPATAWPATWWSER